MTKRCMICGKDFETNRRDRKTCGAPECMRQRQLAYMKEYASQNKELRRAGKNEYNRQYAAKRRAKAKSGKTKRPVREFEAEGYAERQIRKSLELAGSICLEL